MSNWCGIKLCLDSWRESQKFCVGRDCDILECNNKVYMHGGTEKDHKPTNWGSRSPADIAEYEGVYWQWTKYVYAHTLSQQGLKPHDSRPILVTFPHWTMMRHRPFYKTLALERSTFHTAGRYSSTESRNVQVVDIFHFSKPYTVLYSKWSDLQISTLARAIV